MLRRRTSRVAPTVGTASTAACSSGGVRCGRDADPCPAHGTGGRLDPRVVEYIGPGKGSALEVTQRSWEVSLWRGGGCTRYEVYWNADDGERAFGERTAD